MTNQKRTNHKNLLDRYLPNAIKAGCVTIDCHGEPFSVVYQDLRLLFKPEVKAVEAMTNQNRSLK